MDRPPDILYLGRSRLHRSRANLIQTLQTVAAFERLGLHVRLFLPPWPRHISLGDQLQSFGVPATLDVQSSRLLHPRWHFRPFVWARRRTLRDARAIYTRSPEMSLVLAGAGVPHHLEIHDTRSLRESGRLEPLVAHHRAGMVRTLIPISRAAAAALTAAGAVAERVHVAPSGVDPAAYANIPPLEPAALDRPRITYLGRLSAGRGLGIFNTLAGRHGYAVTLLGDQDPAERIDPAIRLHGFVPPRDVPAWYARTDLVLLPYQPAHTIIDSISPIKLFEAMAAGRPILISDLPAMREIIEHERTGLLVEAGNPQAWAAAIERLRSDRHLAIRLAANARTESARYTWAARARGLAQAMGFPLPPSAHPPPG